MKIRDLHKAVLSMIGGVPKRVFEEFRVQCRDFRESRIPEGLKSDARLWGGVEPCGHRVIVKPDPIEEVTASGIVISVGDKKEREQAAQTTGVIVAIGPTAWADFGGDPWASVGDRVYYAKYGGWKFDHEGEEYRLLNDEDVTARFRSE